MLEFQGKKFIPTNEIIEVFDIYGNKYLKTKFIPTKAYMDYLKLKEMYEEQQELIKLKATLDFQMQTFGEVDDVDYQRYMYLVGRCYKK